MKNYYVSIDFDKTKPISLEEIQQIAFDSKTDDGYADYLQMVLNNAKGSLSKIDGECLNEIEFGIHESGCIIPFGESSSHPYARKNFYKPLEEVIQELPPLPEFM
ncbi:MAG TPA: hypothetical protein VGP43_02445 [Chitinophagaceae bacterium]|nr:hypothetical protein [Chitinophagaceae bacterium]